MNPPPAFSRGHDTVPRPVERGVSAEDFPFEGARGDGRRVWKESRQELRRQQEESITQGVQRLRVGERAGQADAVGGGGDIWTDGDEVECDAEEDDSGDVFPLRAPNMGGRGGRGRASMNVGRRRKRPSATSPDAEGEGDGEGGRNFWSVDHMVTLIRAKRDQDAQLQAAGHTFARMRSREWKWLDVRERLLKVGVDRPADKCGKKWDNLMQQFKKIHTFMGMLGKEDFFQLTSQQRAEKGFSFNMDRAIYEEIKGAKERSHTISPSNVADTGGAGGVQLPSAQSATPESVGDGDADGDRTHPRKTSHSSTPQEVAQTTTQGRHQWTLAMKKFAEMAFGAECAKANTQDGGGAHCCCRSQGASCLLIRGDVCADAQTAIGRFRMTPTTTPLCFPDGTVTRTHLPAPPHQTPRLADSNFEF
ncbi:hypothetical protein CBR_g17877 [Chara braunii]|uniref:Myb/SANT-like DNA-binding domain-containing protein n=1 Tax=Chara braunii TaxID=69332 RepID=A0A388KVT1_CHABU|nr:hypothetical protein CBR_g17877 [Chara braunii]|eukprot:GBG74164.1 hypothetical protein CBR_g17877 [Chara braunii]